jgi:hypothetical protein
MKPTYWEFCEAYYIIMRFIDTEPHSRTLFHALFAFKAQIREEEE